MWSRYIPLLGVVRWAITVCFLPYPFLASEPLSWLDVQLGGIVGVIFFFAQWLASLRVGDTPLASVMGSKFVRCTVYRLFGFQEGFLQNFGLPRGYPWPLHCWVGTGPQTIPAGLGISIYTAASFGLVDALVPSLQAG